MAFRVRIDNVVVGGGTANVIHTAGQTPLPAASEGWGLRFTDVEDFKAQMADFRGDAREILLKLLLAYWAQRNPTLNNPSLLIGRTITIDFDSATPSALVTVA